MNLNEIRETKSWKSFQFCCHPYNLFKWTINALLDGKNKGFLEVKPISNWTLNIMFCISLMHCSLVYISTSIWVLGSPSAGWNLLFLLLNVKTCEKTEKRKKIGNNEAKNSVFLEDGKPKCMCESKKKKGMSKYLWYNVKYK